MSRFQVWVVATGLLCCAVSFSALMVINNDLTERIETLEKQALTSAKFNLSNARTDSTQYEMILKIQDGMIKLHDIP